ncbi:MAG: septum formation initiator family protein [Ignavibacteriaceae bacterium]|jgi:cell division protein FtsL
MLSLKGRKLRFYIFFVLFLIAVVFLFFNESGVFKYARLQKEVNSLSDQIQELQDHNKDLQAEIDSLQRKVPAKIEKIAREKYGMKRPGEKSIEVIEK